MPSKNSDAKWCPNITNVASRRGYTNKQKLVKRVHMIGKYNIVETQQENIENASIVEMKTTWISNDFLYQILYVFGFKLQFDAWRGYSRY